MIGLFADHAYAAAEMHSLSSRSRCILLRRGLLARARAALSPLLSRRRIANVTEKILRSFEGNRRCKACLTPSRQNCHYLQVGTIVPDPSSKQTESLGPGNP